MPHICRWKDHRMITWCVLTTIAFYVQMLSTACLLSEKPFSPKKDGVCIYKKASHSKTSFPVVPSNFSMHFLLEGPFIKIIFVIAFWDAFLCVLLAIQYGMNLKGKFVGWYKTLFVQLSFWLQFFFSERELWSKVVAVQCKHTQWKRLLK